MTTPEGRSETRNGDGPQPAGLPVFLHAKKKYYFNLHEGLQEGERKSFALTYVARFERSEGRSRLLPLSRLGSQRSTGLGRDGLG